MGFVLFLNKCIEISTLIIPTATIGTYIARVEVFWVPTAF